MMGWTIRRKMMAWFLVMSVFFLAAGGFAIYVVNWLNTTTAKILRENQPILNDMAVIESSVLFHSLKVSQYVSTGNRAHLRAVEDLRNAAQVHLEDLERRTRGTPDEPIVQQIREAYNTYTSLSDEMLAYYAQHPTDTASVEGRQIRIAALLENSLLAQTRMLYETKQEQTAALEQARTRVSQMYFAILLFSTVSSLAVFVAMIIAFDRSVTIPVAHLSRAAERIAAGDLAVRVPFHRQDELGMLAHAFNDMAARLQALVGTLEQQVAQRTADLARRTAQLEAAAHVARRAAEIRRLDALLSETVRLISDRFGFYHAGIFLVDEMGEYAVLRAASSEGGQRMLARGHRLAVGKVGIVGYVAATGEPRIALDVGEDAVFFDNPDLPHTRSEMALPLKVRDRVIGVLDVQSVEPAAFTQEDVKVLQTMADQIALAIENARLLEESQRAVAEVRSLYGEYLREAWMRLARQEPVLGYHQSARGGRFLTADEVQSLRENPAIWSVLARGEVYAQSASDDGEEALLLAPVRLQERVIGVLQVKSPVKGYRWSSEEVAMVRSIADRLALALENARLLEETRRHAERDRMIAEITARVRASMDPETVLRTALRELGAALGADRVMVRMMSSSYSEEVGSGGPGVAGS